MIKKVILRLCYILIFSGVYFLVFCKKDKKKEQHIQWWENYYAQKEKLLTTEEETIEEEADDVWATAPQTALLRKEVLEKILNKLNLLSNASFTFVSNKVIATVQKNNNVLVFRMIKNSWILFVDYNLIVDEETTSKLLDFKTVINNNEEDFNSTIENLKIWFEEEHIFG